MNITGKRNNDDINDNIINDIKSKKLKSNRIFNLIYYVKNIMMDKNMLFIDELFEFIIYNVSIKKINTNQTFIIYIFMEIYKLNMNFNLIKNMLNEIIKLKIIDLDKFIENYKLYLNAKTLLLLINPSIRNELFYNTNNLSIIEKINIIYKNNHDYNYVIKYITINFKNYLYGYFKILSSYECKYVYEILNKYYDEQFINNTLSISTNILIRTDNSGAWF